MLLQQNLFDSGSYVVTSETSNVASMVVALKNGKLSVYQTDLEDKIQNSAQFEQGSNAFCRNEKYRFIYSCFFIALSSDRSPRDGSCEVKICSKRMEGQIQ